MTGSEVNEWFRSCLFEIRSRVEVGTMQSRLDSSSTVTHVEGTPLTGRGQNTCDGHE